MAHADELKAKLATAETELRVSEGAREVLQGSLAKALSSSPAPVSKKPRAKLVEPQDSPKPVAKVRSFLRQSVD